MMNKRYSWLVPGVVAGSLVPLVVLAELAARGELGADPISVALNQFGFVALVLLLASLACTPLKIILRKKWPLRIRKALGLMGFFYVVLHVSAYVGLDQGFDFNGMLADVEQNTFILVGFVAFVLLIPLAITSTKNSPRRLGKNWKRIHWLVYLIAPLVIIHFTMRMKADIRQPLTYGAVVAVLLLIRVGDQAVKRWNGPAWKGARAFKVAKREPDAGQICTLYLEPLDGKKLPSYKPGQYLTFQLNIGDRPRPVVRCYSLSDRPDGKRYRISVKREVGAGPDKPPGVASNFIHDHIQENDVLDVKAPRGKFVVQSFKRRPVVLVGGGIGVTPLLAMLQAQAAVREGREVYFFLGVRNSGDHGFRNQLAAIATANPRIRMQVFYSAPLPTDRVGREYDHAGRISAEQLQEILPTLDCDFYVCGPPAMMAQLKTDLAAGGVPPQRFHMEAFGSATVKRVAPAGAAAGKILVTFELSGKTVEWDPTYGSLLELAEANGIFIDCGCRAGNCGTCEVEINSGEVEYEVEAGAEPEEGACLTCVTVPVTDVSLQA